MKRTIHTTARWICLALGVLLSLSLTAPNAAAKPVALFYLGTDPNSVRSFLAHYKQIDLLVPTWYDLDSDGLLTGEPDPPAPAFRSAPPSSLDEPSHRRSRSP